MYNFQVIILSCLGQVFHGISYKLLPLHLKAGKTFERHSFKWQLIAISIVVLFILIINLKRVFMDWVEQIWGRIPLQSQNITCMFLKDTCFSPSCGATQNSNWPLKTTLELSNTREIHLAWISIYIECVFMLMTLEFWKARS